MIDVVSYLNTGLSVTPQNREASQELGKDAFMELLVAQMTYQNPLEPMENTEFIAQLAQFSALEQQQNIAAGIEMLALTQTAATNSQMVNLIGKRVIVPGSSFSVDKESQDPVKLQFNLAGGDEAAAPAEIIIRNKEGDAVRSIDITAFNAGRNEILFDGKDNNGNPLETGNYTYQVVGHDGQPVEGLTAYSNYLVDAVAFDGTTILLKSEGTTIDLGDISEVIKN